MERYRLAIVVGFPLIWHLAFTGYAYARAAQSGMHPRRWALVVFLLPLVGIILFVFEREDRALGPDDRRIETPYRIHPTQEDDDADRDES